MKPIELDLQAEGVDIEELSEFVEGLIEKDPSLPEGAIISAIANEFDITEEQAERFLEEVWYA